MDVKTLKGSIHSGSIPQFLIFIVDDSAFARQYVDAMAKALNKPVSYYETADEVIYDCSSNLVDDKLFIIVDDKKVLDNDKYVDTLKNLKRNVVVIFNNIDEKKYKKFLSTNEKWSVVFSKLDVYSLVSYCENMCKGQGVVIEQDKLKLLVEYCDNNFGCLKNELEKIFLLNLSKPEFLDKYIEMNGYSDYRKGDTDTLLNKVLQKKVSDSFTYYHKFNDSCDGSVMLLYKLYSSARNLFVKKSDTYYVRILYLINEVYNMILDGILPENLAFKYFMIKLWG